MLFLRIFHLSNHSESEEGEGSYDGRVSVTLEKLFVSLHFLLGPVVVAVGNVKDEK